MELKQFKPKRIYYEPGILQYPQGIQLYSHYQSLSIPMEGIANHNNIESLRTQENHMFPKLKQYLILGTRKTHRYSPNEKVSDFLVPFTSSGCSAMCLYCYLVCNYNKCAYLRIFVNREEMMARLIKKAQTLPKDAVFEIGSNSDLVLENSITNNLPWTITEFTKQPHGKLTFPTKFSMVDSLLNLEHQGRVILRVSLNPQPIIEGTEFGTANLADRIETVNKLCAAGYPVGILVAPIMFTENWKAQYLELFRQMHSQLSDCAKQAVFFEAIFMTYSFVHQKINAEAFPNAKPIYDPAQMTGRGRGKYWYKPDLRKTGESYIRGLFQEYFPDNPLLYIV